MSGELVPIPTFPLEFICSLSVPAVLILKVSFHGKPNLVLSSPVPSPVPSSPPVTCTFSWSDTVPFPDCSLFVLYGFRSFPDSFLVFSFVSDYVLCVLMFC